AAPTNAGDTPVEKLEALGVRGILWQLARDGQIIDMRCEMPQCYCFRGRRYFAPRRRELLQELVRACVLEQEAARARAQGGVDVVVEIEGGENEHPRVGEISVCADETGGLEP